MEIWRYYVYIFIDIVVQPNKYGVAICFLVMLDKDIRIMTK